MSEPEPVSLDELLTRVGQEYFIAHLEETAAPRTPGTELAAHLSSVRVALVRMRGLRQQVGETEYRRALAQIEAALKRAR